eukprot:5976312-Amphidinium_carterae.1
MLLRKAPAATRREQLEIWKGCEEMQVELAVLLESALMTAHQASSVAFGPVLEPVLYGCPLIRYHWANAIILRGGHSRDCLGGPWEWGVRQPFGLGLGRLQKDALPLRAACVRVQGSVARTT